jgi:Asp-tRNA(Asn)/Glu-tRNA(Gln) amidotransferase A subunit family amidase
MQDQTGQRTEYDLKSVNVPYMVGLPLRLMAALLESPLSRLLAPILLDNMGITWFRAQQFEEPPTFYPITIKDRSGSDSERVPQEEWPALPVESGPGFHFATVLDYAEAYRKGVTTPEQVAHKVLEAIQASETTTPALRAFICLDREDVLRQARAATERYQDGQPLSVFDGVPVAIKDELDMTPFPTTVGTAFLGRTPAKQDATIVARMRATGAMLIGKTNMHEIGIGVTGHNPHYGTARNPYNPAHYTGGSSSGSSAVVAAGFCPVAIGADGGGSIRIPASFCGIVGLKPTFGRVSVFGGTPLGWSVGHYGFLAATATDAALAYAAIAGPDPKDHLSCCQPSPTLKGWQGADLADLTLGVYWPWFRHATAEVVAACEAMLQSFERMGARLREVTIPNLEAARIAHTICIVSEMAQALDHTYAAHHREHSLEVRINLAVARLLTSRDYIQSQRVRTRTIAHLARALERVDAIVTPATALTAPAIPRAALPHGESDLTTLVEIMRFVTPANMAGLPAISFPAGYDEGGLPIGFQAIGRAWQEPTLLRLALAAEQVVERRKPKVHFAMLPE